MKKIKNIAFILVLLFVFQACSKDFLELEPKTGQVEANFYKTENDAFLAVVGVYDALTVQNWQFVPTMSDIFSDDAFKGGGDATDMEQWNQLERGLMDAENGSAGDLWNRCYSGIYRANLYLQKQNDIAWKTDGLQARLEAETKFIRAYLYWDLVRHYGWVPILETVLPNVEDYKNVPQNTPQEVYTFIAKDLLAAISNLPETVSADQAGRITKHAAKALLARIYMFHEGFAKPVLGVGAWTDGTTTIDKAYAKQALEDVILSGDYQLVSNYADVFKWDNENNSESLLEFQYSEKSNSGDWGGWGINGNFSVTWISPRDPQGNAIYSKAGWSFSMLTWSLFDEFETGDPRKDVTFFYADDELSQYTKAYQNTGYFNRKYIARADFPAIGGDPVHNWRKNYIDIRYADVLLMAAELNLSDNLTKAQMYYEQVRKRALGSAHVAPTLTNNEAGLDKIYHERRVEFGGEGLRKWDLLRRSFTYTTQKINASFSVAGKTDKPQDYVGYGFNPQNYGMFPIPASEIRNMNAGVFKQFIPAYQ